MADLDIRREDALGREEPSPGSGVGGGAKPWVPFLKSRPRFAPSAETNRAWCQELPTPGPGQLRPAGRSSRCLPKEVVGPDFL